MIAFPTLKQNKLTDYRVNCSPMLGPRERPLDLDRRKRSGIYTPWTQYELQLRTGTG